MSRTKSRGNELSSEALAEPAGCRSNQLEPDMHAFVEVVRVLKYIEPDLRWAVLEAVESFFRKFDRRGRDD